MQGMLGNVVQLCAQKKGEMCLVDIVFSEEVEIVQTTLRNLAEEDRREMGHEVKKRFICLMV